MAKKFISLLAAMAVIGGGVMLAKAQSSPVLAEGVAAHDGLDEIYRRFSEGYKKLDPAMVANLYSETAAYLAPGKEIEIGRARVLATFIEFFDSVRQKNGRLEISFRIAQRQAEQNLAYDVGVYTLTSFSDKGESRTSKGKFMVVGKREKDGVGVFRWTVITTCRNRRNSFNRG